MQGHGTLHGLYQAKAHRHRRTGESEGTPSPAAWSHVADTVIEANIAEVRGVFVAVLWRLRHGVAEEVW